ncbi:hypothetical protein [Pseudoalteromonas phenolica]|uniref:hypothetical protein n=1 Tax=Pseudoalteromonas phenolica TaxID=161398 RepID=UPI001BB0E854|nr:hypothetical protein [Pseudoalteromonas phenolica]
MKKPHRLLTDKEAVEKLLNHKYFVPHKTPIQIFNRATDPFLPNVKDSLFEVLSLLANRGLTNNVIVITRFKVSVDDAKRLNTFKPLKLNLFFTYSGIGNKSIEAVDSKIAENSLKMAFREREHYKVFLYWRPIIPGINDSEEHIRKAAELSTFSDGVAFTGLFFREEIKKYYEENGLPLLYTDFARRKIFPEKQEKMVLELFKKFKGEAIYRKTSCAIAGAWNEPDYNGHYGIKELCDICSEKQVKVCEAQWVKPREKNIDDCLKRIGASTSYKISERAIIFRSLPEQDRYFIQHNLGYQAHDSTKPHFIGRHGRAEIGWGESDVSE